MAWRETEISGKRRHSAHGDLILTSTSLPHIYLLDPSQSTPSAELLYTFPDATATLGITETSADVFAVVVGNVSLKKFEGVPGSFSIWSVDFSTSSTPTVKEIAAIPQAKLLNGLTHTNNAQVVLAADSEQGVVYSLNVVSGVSAVAIQDSAFAPVGTNPLGVNGIHANAAGTILYFTNSAAGTFGSIPINANGQATGAVTIIANDAKGCLYDDVAVDSQGNAWITDHSDGVVEVTKAGQQTTILNSTNFTQPTAAILSYGGQQLYVVTDGDATNQSQSGQVFVVNI